jgi:type VI secretion system protein VasD
VNSYLKTTISAIAILVAMGAVKGCATADVVGSHLLKQVLKPDPTVIEATVKVATDVNPDSRGRPSPVKTRFYLLESASVFRNTDFFQLKTQDRELLSGDVKVREEMVFKPGQQEPVELSLPPDETPEDGKLYLAVMVGYWDIDRSQWRVVREVEVQETTEVLISIARSDVSIKVLE